MKCTNTRRSQATLALLLLLAASPLTLAQAPVAESLADYRGKVVLLDFWASWCGPCRRSFPWMNAMLAKYSDQDFVIVAVNLDQKRADADRFLERYPAQFTVWFDPAGALAERFDVQAMPTSIVLNPDGAVAAVHRGFKTRNAPVYERAIVEALAAARASVTNQRLDPPNLPLIATGAHQ